LCQCLLWRGHDQVFSNKYSDMKRCITRSTFICPLSATIHIETRRKSKHSLSASSLPSFLLHLRSSFLLLLILSHLSCLCKHLKFNQTSQFIVQQHSNLVVCRSDLNHRLHSKARRTSRILQSDLSFSLTINAIQVITISLTFNQKQNNFS
jgi:hypothetical protein